MPATTGYYWLLLAEGHLNRRRFGAMLGRIALLRYGRDSTGEVRRGIWLQRGWGKETCCKSGLES